MNTGIPDDSVKDYYRLLTASKKGKNVKQKLRYDTILLYLEGYPGKQEQFRENFETLKNC